MVKFQSDRGVLKMADMTSKDDEKARELAMEKGRKEEQERQRERELAAQKGRQQGMTEERAREKGKGGLGKGITIVLILILLIVVVAAAAYLTLSLTVTNASPGNPMPFTTNYGVSFPEGQTIALGNTHINVLSYQNELITDIDGDREKLIVGEDRVISDRRVVITTLGGITLMDTFFRIDFKYNGERDNRAFFDMAVHTSKQVPDYLLRHLLPPEMDARPI